MRLTSLDGKRIYIVTEHVVALREPVENEVVGAGCAVELVNGKAIYVKESVDKAIEIYEGPPQRFY